MKDDLPEVPEGYKWESRDGNMTKMAKMLRPPGCTTRFPNRIYSNELKIWVLHDGRGTFEKIAHVNTDEEAYAILAARAWAGLPIGD
jgi:hypothetical protein